MPALRASLRWLLPALIVAAGCAAASVWQYGRGVQKDAALIAYADALQAPAVPLADAAMRPSDLPVRVNGTVRPMSTGAWVMLDNQIRDSRVGVRAYAIVRPSPQQPWMLADFGWLPFGPDRTLTDVPALPESIDVRGLLVPLPGQGMRLGANPAMRAGEPVLVTYLDPAELAAQLQQPIADRVLRVDADVAFGFARDATLQPTGLPPERHYGYALQWGGLAIAVIVIYLFLSFRKPRA